MSMGPTAAAEQSDSTMTGPGMWTIGGLLLALALLTAVAGYHLAQQRDHRTPAIQVRGAAPASRPVAAMSRFTVYVVGSEERAATLAANVDEANALRESLGLPPLRYVVVADTGSTAPALAAHWDDALVAPAGGSLVQLIDLRAGS